MKQEDHSLVDYLYDELSEEDAKAFERDADAEELSSLRETLALFSEELPEEEPRAQLDALILATARQTAEEIQEESENKGILGWFKRLTRSPLLGLIAAGSVAAFVAISVVPQMDRMQSPAMQSPAPGVAQAEKSAPETSALRLSVPKKKSGARKTEWVRDPDTKEEREAAVERTAEPEMKSRNFGEVAKKRARKRTAKDKGRAGALSFGMGEGAASGGHANSEELAKARAEMDAMKPPPVAKPKAPMPSAAEPAPIRGPAPPAESPQPRRPRPARRVAGMSQRKPEEAQDVRTQQAKGLELLRAVEQELAKGGVRNARRMLTQALSKTKGAPVYGDILFRLARLEYDQKNCEGAYRYARRAAGLPTFKARSQAVNLMAACQEIMDAERGPVAPAKAAPALAPAEQSMDRPATTKSP